VFSGYRSLLGRNWLDGLLLLLLGATAFLLGCYELGDSDIWWHLRGGQWILENGRTPHLDPFTFGSADRLWVDIHWSYEIILALCYRAGGVAGLVLLGAVLGAAAVFIVVTARRREWSMAVSALCWLPTLVLLAFRLDPRPEMFSLLYLACYLAILWRADERPRLLWLLPFVQVLWSNVQGLFVLGPIVLGMYGTARGAAALWRRGQSQSAWTEEEKRRGKRFIAVLAVVALACLVNPYFARGAWFPFELFPKVTDPNNPYKKYIDELKSPAERVQESTMGVLGKDWFFLAFYFLFSLLALSFLYPAVWRASGGDSQRRWRVFLSAAIALLVLGTLTLRGDYPNWLQIIGDNIPLFYLIGGIAAGLALRRRNPSAALLAAVSGAALGSLLVWLDVSLLGKGRGLFSSVASAAEARVPFILAWAVAGAMILRWRADLFRLLLAGAFAYLSLQALQNWTRFALVAGTVMTWNFAEWAAAMRSSQPQESPNRARWLPACARLTLAAALGLWIVLLISDRFYIYSGFPRHFAFAEEPLAFAHDAVRFAGSPGLPERALVYGLDQTGVYDFHNAPRCKPFMDGRLEMPALRTFETYVNIEDWLATADPRWQDALKSLGDPLVLLGHEGLGRATAEALLLTHPNWRCVYFDALAAVFVPRDRVDQKAFPAIDFAARHFHETQRPSIPNLRRAATREAKALYNLSASLPQQTYPWNRRLPLLLHAHDRACLALEENKQRADVWIVLGNTYRDLNPNAATVYVASGAEWQSERDLGWAQATYCFRQAVELQPDNATAWRYLAMVYSRRRLIEAELAASEQWLRLDRKVPEAQRDRVKAMRRTFTAQTPHVDMQEPVLDAVSRLALAGRPISALERIEAAGQSSWPWPFAERVAALYMHLGRPAEARRVWREARDCPSPALRDCRLAISYWVELDFKSAMRCYLDAKEKEANLSEIWWGLARLHTQLGDAKAASEACRRGLSLKLPASQRMELEALQTFLALYAAKP
jgi:tetratricopeptide (TPR) repeat protein